MQWMKFSTSVAGNYRDQVRSGAAFSTLSAHFGASRDRCVDAWRASGPGALAAGINHGLDTKQSIRSRVLNRPHLTECDGG